MANCKYQKKQYKYSNDNGQTWHNVVPEQIKTGDLIEYDSPDCSSIDAIYRWEELDGQYICVDNVKYTKEIRYESYDAGATWYVSYPTVYRAGQRVGVDEDFCADKFEGHYIGNDTGNICPNGYSWNGYKCVYVDPIKIVKCDGNPTLTSADTAYYSSNFKLFSAVIGDCVTIIGKGAFNHCSKLPSITIPNTVTKIGGAAFANCSSLSSITIPDSVELIGEDHESDSVGAFEACTGLTSVTFGNGLKYITDRAFYRCSSLTSINIPDNVEYIGYYTFQYCFNLKNVTIGTGITNIGQDAFENCTKLTSITVNATTPPTLGTDAFASTQNCPIYVPCESVSAYKSASRWSTYADRIQGNGNCSGTGSKFKLSYSTGIVYSGECGSSTTLTTGETKPSRYDCSTMTSAEIGGCVRTLGGWAFSTCRSLTSITIPNSVTSIGSGAFDRCSSLSSITIPSGVTSIGDVVFQNCTSLTSVTIPDSVTSIGDFVFASCSGLTSVTVNATTPPTLGGGAFRNTNENFVIYVPAASVEAYKSASGWSTYASHIQAIP